MDELNQNPTGVKPQLDFMTAVKICLQEKFSNFEGRARRSEFWWFYLACAVVNYALNLIFGFFSPTAAMVVSGIFSLAILVPSLAVGARRLHDIGKSGWMQLLAIIPIVGAIILIVWWAQDGSKAENEYGPSPKY